MRISAFSSSHFFLGLGLRTHLKSAEAEEDVRKKADEAVRGVGGKTDDEEE